MSFSDSDVTRRMRKNNFLNQLNQLINWKPIEQVIAQHYALASDATGRPACRGLLLFTMFLTVTQ